MKSIFRARSALLLACAALFSHAVSAQVTFDGEYGKRLKAYQTISPGGETPFGEQINLYTGELTFSQTDLAYDGQGPKIVINRTTVDSQKDKSTDPPSFGVWELSIPRIETLTGAGWDWGSSENNYARCSDFKGSLSWFSEWWHGIEFITEDGAHHPMMARVPEYGTTPSITLNGQSLGFGAVTLDNWQFACLPETANAAITGTTIGGEGFLAISPNGTKYWLDYLVTKSAGNVYENDEGGAGRFVTHRKFKVMYVTKIEDRFGNSITYHYTGDQLTSITASDGREVDIAWRPDAPFIDSITQQPGDVDARTWQYAYTSVTTTGAFLNQVTLPDNSTWSFSGAVSYPSDFAYPIFTGLDSCTKRSATSTATPIANPATITAPSGVKGVFDRTLTYHGRSYVPSGCVLANLVEPQHESIVPLFGTYALTKRTISGPGLTTQVWNYKYPPTAVGSTTSDSCAASGACQDTAYLEITDPQGNLTRHTFSTRAGAINPVRWVSGEGKETKTEWYQGTSTLLRIKTFRYAAYDRGPYPLRIGDSLNLDSVNTAKLETWTPLDRTQTTQQGVTFTSEVAAGMAGFDAFARRVNVTNSNTQGHSRNEVTAYHDNVAKWTLGQAASSTVDGTVVSSTTYDANELPWKVYAFGKLKQTMTYNTDGTLASVTDGNNNTTTLGSWKRGIPQSIHFPVTPEAPSGATLAAKVDDLGQIEWTEDPYDYRTCYDFDVMGRLKTLTYPSETQTHVCDTSKWNQLTRTVAPVAGTQYGIPAGHWTETVTTGSHETTTYFDALWQPLVVREYQVGLGSSMRFRTYAYDAHGRKTFSAYPSTIANATQGVFTSYDALGRVTQVTQDSEIGALKTTTAYLGGPEGYYTKVIDPRGNITRTWYLAYDQPKYDTPVEIHHPAGAYTSITRDPSLGTPTAITRHNLDNSLSETRALTYNSVHELCRVDEPETGASLMGYDAAGNLSWSAAGYTTTPGCKTASSVGARRVDRAYDARNRLQTLSFADINGSQAWSYTKDSLPAQVDTMNEDGNVIVSNTYNYNHRRLLTGETQSQPETGPLSLGYTFDGNGVLSSIAYPRGRMVNYAPNGLGQPTIAGSYATGVSYYPNGAMSGFTYGNGIVHTMTQNVRQLPEQSIDSGGVLNDSYDYDQNGNVQAISDGLAGANGNRDMTYDGLDRLLTTNSPMFGGTTATYTYDVLDNLTHAVAPGRNWYYCYDASWRLTNLKTASCSGSTVVGLGYDLQGNLVNKNGQAYVFDLGNRLREATGKESYRYDANGRRVAAIAQNGAPAVGTIYSYYGQDGVLRFQRDERQGKETDYISLNGSLVAGVATPIAPTSVGLSVPATSNTGSYTVNWTAAGSATSYVLQEQVGGSWSTIQISSAISKSITSKPNGTYHYRAQACNPTDCSAWSNTGTITVTLPPNQVPAITAPDTSTGSYTVSWTPSATADNYLLQERVNGGSWATFPKGNSLSQAYAGKSVATYDYQVQACNGGGCSEYSAIKTVQVLLAPAGTPVVTVPSTSNTGSYTVSWTTTPTADSYDLQENVGGAWTTILPSTTETSHAISGKANGTYVYRVRACNASGCGNWGNEDSIQVTLPPASAPTVTVPSTSYTGSYTVSWTSVATADTYTLQEYAGASWSTFPDTSALSKSISSKAAGTYSYRAKACNTGGCTGWSTIDTITVTLKPASAPTLTLPSSSSTGSYTASWTSVGAATSYALDEQVGSGSWAQIQKTSALSKALNGKGDGSYSYRVRACNVAGCSGYSLTDTITVLTPPSATSTITTPATNYTGSYSVTWTGAAKATSYTLQRKIGSGSYATVYTGATRSWAASGQSPNTYSYRVEGCNSAGCGPWSAVKSTVVHGPPAMPATLTGSSYVEYEFRPPIKNFDVSWSATADTDHYELEQSINGTASIVYSGTGTSWGTSGINNSREYRVRACNAAGCSAWKGPLGL